MCYKASFGFSLPLRLNPNCLPWSAKSCKICSVHISGPFFSARDIPPYEYLNVCLETFHGPNPKAPDMYSVM